MTLQKCRLGWPHDPAKTQSVPLTGGPIMLQMGWPHDPAKIGSRLAP